MTPPVPVGAVMLFTTVLTAVVVAVPMLCRCR
jgi:hypothetical protein